MSDNSSWYYTDNTGAQVGPVPTSELKSLISEGKIPASSFAWTEGMGDWQAASQIPALQNTATSPPAAKKTAKPAAAPSATVDPYSTPSANPNTGVIPGSDYFDPGEYGGIRRLNYFLRNFLLFVAYLGSLALIVQFALNGDINSESSTAAIVGIGAAFLVFLFIYVRIKILRIRNIGYSAWWILLMIVPLVSNILGIILLAFPEGFAQRRKLDTPGLIIVIIALAIVALYILAIIASVFQIISQS